jgi:hypothetical protein
VLGEIITVFNIVTRRDKETSKNDFLDRVKNPFVYGKKNATLFRVAFKF